MWACVATETCRLDPFFIGQLCTRLAQKVAFVGKCHLMWAAYHVMHDHVYRWRQCLSEVVGLSVFVGCLSVCLPCLCVAVYFSCLYVPVFRVCLIVRLFVSLAFVSL